VYGGNSIVGSNPIPSATSLILLGKVAVHLISGAAGAASVRGGLPIAAVPGGDDQEEFTRQDALYGFAAITTAAPPALAPAYDVERGAGTAGVEPANGGIKIL
jgi:hypothetical protein